MVKSTKSSTSIRLSSEARELMRLLSAQMGISQSSVMELAIRRMAEREGAAKPMHPATKIAHKRGVKGSA
jgi:predicted transcriptional regulator